MHATEHLAALAGAYESAMTEVGRAAAAARAQIDADLAGLPHPDVAYDDVRPYVPPPAAGHNALVADTPLVDSPLSGSSLAFDDAPLWQS